MGIQKWGRAQASPDLREESESLIRSAELAKEFFLSLLCMGTWVQTKKRGFQILFGKTQTA